MTQNFRNYRAQLIGITNQLPVVSNRLVVGQLIAVAMQGVTPPAYSMNKIKIALLRVHDM